MKKVQQYMKTMHMVEKSDRIVIGLSGGADSVALLLVLQTLRQELELQLFAVHINHGIRREASADADYAKRLCEQLEVPFFLFEADVPEMAEKYGKTVEEMGRLYRYQCFDEVMERVEAKKLAVAHHMDDQAETMLFHLIRGSRIAGMTGMRPVSEFWYAKEQGTVSSKQIIRPLLCCRKEELIEWLNGQQAEWKEDSTNTDNAYSRNCIRNQVVPVLETINTRAVAHMAEFAEEMAGYQAFFQRVVDAYLREEVTMNDSGGYVLDRNHLMEQDEVLQNAVLYEMLVRTSRNRKDIGSVHVQTVRELLYHQTGKKNVLPGEIEVQISYENLIIRKRLQENERAECFEVDVTVNTLEKWNRQGMQIVLPDGGCLWIHLYKKSQCSKKEWSDLVKEAGNSKNNYTKFFEYDTINDTLCVRTVRQNDYFVLNGAGTRKKVSRYMIDEKIPVWKRRRMLVLAMNEKILWIIGRRRCEEYKVSGQSEMILKLMYEGV